MQAVRSGIETTVERTYAAIKPARQLVFAGCLENEAAGSQVGQQGTAHQATPGYSRRRYEWGRKPYNKVLKKQDVKCAHPLSAAKNLLYTQRPTKHSS